MKLVFTAISIVVFCKFNRQLALFDRSDLGIIQKWLQSLLLLLVFFNDPLCLFSHSIPWLYRLQQSLLESAFLALLMFFWLMFVHSISISTMLAISPTNFFAPKLCLTVLFFTYLVYFREFVYSAFAQDPFFSLKNHRKDLIQSKTFFFGAMMSVLYLIYFGLLALKAHSTIS
jgi:hypothetical protein